MVGGGGAGGQAARSACGDLEAGVHAAAVRTLRPKWLFPQALPAGAMHLAAGLAASVASATATVAQRLRRSVCADTHARLHGLSTWL